MHIMGLKKKKKNSYINNVRCGSGPDNTEVRQIRNNLVFTKITEKYNQMTKSEKKIAEYFLQNGANIGISTISAVADACEVSPASLTRFAHNLGYKGFMDFRIEMSLSQSRFSDEDKLNRELTGGDNIDLLCGRLCDVCEDALEQTRTQLDPVAIKQAVDLLWSAKTVYCFGQGNSSSVAMDAWARFTPITTKFHWVSDSHIQSHISALLDEDDVILCYSFSGSTRELVENAKLLQHSKGKLILITHFPNSIGAQLSDLVLICGVNESPKNQGSIAARIGQLLITEVLYNEYCSRNPELASGNRGKSISAVHGKLFDIG